MNIKKILTENLYTGFFTFCCVILAQCALLRIEHIKSPGTVILFSAVFTAASVMVYTCRKKSAVFTGIAAFTVILFLSLYRAGFSVIKLTENTVCDILSGKELKTYEILFVTAAMSLVFSVLMIILSRIPPVRFFLAAAAVCVLVYYGIFGYVPDRTETFSASGIIVCALLQLSLSLLYSHESAKKINSILSFMLPVYLLFSVSVVLIPSSSHPVSWNFVKNTASWIADKTEHLVTDISLMLFSDNLQYKISMQGYSDSDGIFSNKLSKNDQSQLSLYFANRPYSSVYLIGSVSDTYTGNGWSSSDNENFSIDDYYLDYCETMLALDRADLSKDDTDNLIKKTNLIIKYDNIVTRSLFYPLKTIKVSDAATFNAASPSAVFKQRVRRGNTYNINYTDIDYRSPLFEKILRTPFSYDKQDNAAESLPDLNVPSDIYQILKKRHEYIEKTYLSVPDSVEPDLKRLAGSITQNCKNDYDKLCAIESYLHTFSYTTAPGAVPEGRDPVEYFLFESKTGYCTYFSSAMALLARCEGIPTRYVQGFVVDTKDAQTHKFISATGSNAHAWCEAYIEGTGWIPFEPTSSLYSSRYSYTESKPVNVPDFDSVINIYKPSEFAQPPVTAPQPVPAGIHEEKSKTSPYIAAFLTVLAGIILLFSAYTGLRIRFFIKKYRTSEDTEKFMICFRIIQYLCNKNKLFISQGETIDQFALKISQVYDSADNSFEEITHVFDRVRYGGSKVLPEQLTQTEKYLRNMFEKSIQKRSRFYGLLIFTEYCLKV